MKVRLNILKQEKTYQKNYPSWFVFCFLFAYLSQSQNLVKEANVLVFVKLLRFLWNLLKVFKYKILLSNTRYKWTVCYRTETEYLVLSAAENGLKFLMNMLVDDRRYPAFLKFTKSLVVKVYDEVFVRF